MSGIREEFTHEQFGFKEYSRSIIWMPTDFLFELAQEEAPYRTEEDSDDLKSILFDNDAYAKSPRLKKLFDEWDFDKCEPIEVKKEGTIYTINNGFHRIRVAHDKGVTHLSVSLHNGKFILGKHVYFSDLPELLDMISGLFKEFRTIAELKAFLTRQDIDANKMKHTSIVYKIINGDLT